MHSCLELVAVVCSHVSIAGWVLAGMYQLYLGYKNKNIGFSPMFLVGYVVGDICNVFGCFWGDQMTFQKVIVCVTLVTDSMMALQYIYYNTGSRALAHSHSSGRSSGISTAIVTASMFGISHAHHTTSPPPPPQMDYRFLIGQVMAWCAQIFYVSGVVPQVYRNFTTKCTGGVSKFLFMADLVGSVGYIATLMATAQAADEHEAVQFLFDELAYLLGTSACLVLDLVLLVQYVIYPEYLEVLEGEQEALVSGDQGNKSECAKYTYT